jgi:hypothetical protein
MPDHVCGFIEMVFVVAFAANDGSFLRSLFRSKVGLSYAIGHRLKSASPNYRNGSHPSHVGHFNQFLHQISDTVVFPDGQHAGEALRSSNLIFTQPQNLRKFLPTWHCVAQNVVKRASVVTARREAQRSVWHCSICAIKLILMRPRSNAHDTPVFPVRHLSDKMCGTLVVISGSTLLVVKCCQYRSSKPFNFTRTHVYESPRPLGRHIQP